MKTMLLILIALSTSCAVLSAQDAQKTIPDSPKTTNQASQKFGEKIPQKPAAMPELQDATPAADQSGESRNPSLLKEAGPGGVEDAARKAAHNLSSTSKDSPAKPGSQAKAADGPKKTETTVSEIGEFHTLPASKDHDSAKPVVQKDQSAARRIHGDVYGAGSNLGHATSESVGATSKSGKTSVYVEGGQAASSAPQQ